jgi:hypothetical protein
MKHQSTRRRSRHVPAPKTSSLGAYIYRYLFGHLRLKRRDGALKVTWGETVFMALTAPLASRPAATVAAPAPADAASRVLSELAILLNANAENRRVLKHLVYVETALAKKGYAVLDELPVKLLKRAHGQLTALASAWASRDLETLAGRMVSAIERRNGIDVDAKLRAELSAGDRETPVTIAEGRLSDFFLLAGEVIPDTEVGKLATS